MTEFRDLTFGELTLHRWAVDLPLRFRLPAEFVAMPADSGVQVWWLSARDGFFSVTLSMNVGYDRARDVFFGGGEGDGDETTMAAQYANAGVEDVAVERYDVNGIPVLFVEGRQDGRHIASCYLAALIETNAVFLFYSHPTPFREIDGERWMEMKQAILSSGDAARRTR